MPQPTHVTPPVPHALSCLPLTQVPFWQQPLGHVAGPQPAMHVPPSQVPEQAAHETPPVPQAVWDCAVTHWPF